MFREVKERSKEKDRNQEIADKHDETNEKGREKRSKDRKDERAERFKSSKV